jgi:D-alanyl-lipoteichoic acid acyltransferase DltB (MBOAT superfamily)
MLFTSLQWLVFLLTVFILYHIVPIRFRRWVMIGSSFVFYSSWNWRYLPLLIAHILVDWTCGRLMGNSADPGRRKQILILSIIFNLSSLAVFKYYGLILSSLTALGIHLPVLSLTLPLGISFFAFESLSYSIDVYRHTMEPFKSPLELALFVTWFPHLISGPIIRPSVMRSQLGSQDDVTRERFFSGAELMLRGYAKKLLIADWLAVVVNPVFAKPSHFTSLELLIAVYAYAFQIYCDFSAYTDIARGASRWFHIELPENFDHPYESASITEFWHRWHMTLSHWLRDYLYIPLGGNRKGKVRTYVNVMITMLLGGLWHGASWTFMVWGGLQGLYLSIERLLGVTVEGPVGRIARVARQVLTFHLVCLGWIFFRNRTFESAGEMLRGIFAAKFWISQPELLPMLGTLVLILLYGLVSWAGRYLTLPNIGQSWPRQVAVAVGFGLILIGFMIFGASSNVFIYFQF